mmetsp:Transcript_28774/g.73628  ORF Transcript_28774/g.73628 Transcript_28774/m.73628 type:complete len:643 (-) Transcript_28774:93-2021(-)
MSSLASTTASISSKKGGGGSWKNKGREGGSGSPGRAADPISLVLSPDFDQLYRHEVEETKHDVSKYGYQRYLEQVMARSDEALQSNPSTRALFPPLSSSAASKRKLSRVPEGDSHPAALPDDSWGGEGGGGVRVGRGSEDGTRLRGKGEFGSVRSGSGSGGGSVDVSEVKAGLAAVVVTAPSRRGSVATEERVQTGGSSGGGQGRGRGKGDFLSGVVEKKISMPIIGHDDYALARRKSIMKMKIEEDEQERMERQQQQGSIRSRSSLDSVGSGGGGVGGGGMNLRLRRASASLMEAIFQHPDEVGGGEEGGKSNLSQTVSFPPIADNDRLQPLRISIAPAPSLQNSAFSVMPAKKSSGHRDFAAPMTAAAIRAGRSDRDRDFGLGAGSPMGEGSMRVSRHKKQELFVEFRRIEDKISNKKSEDVQNSKRIHAERTWFPFPDKKSLRQNFVDKYALMEDSEEKGKKKAGQDAVQTVSTPRYQKPLQRGSPFDVKPIGRKEGAAQLLKWMNLQTRRRSKTEQLKITRERLRFLETSAVSIFPLICVILAITLLTHTAVHLLHISMSALLQLTPKHSHVTILPLLPCLHLHLFKSRLHPVSITPPPPPFCRIVYCAALACPYPPPLLPSPPLLDAGNRRRKEVLP